MRKCQIPPQLVAQVWQVATLKARVKVSRMIIAPTFWEILFWGIFAVVFVACVGVVLWFIFSAAAEKFREAERIAEKFREAKRLEREKKLLEEEAECLEEEKKREAKRLEEERVKQEAKRLEDEQEAINNDTSRVGSGTHVSCMHCGSFVRKEATKCRHCGRKLTPKKA